MHTPVSCQAEKIITESRLTRTVKVNSLPQTFNGHRLMRRRRTAALLPVHCLASLPEDRLTRALAEANRDRQQQAAGGIASCDPTRWLFSRAAQAPVHLLHELKRWNQEASAKVACKIKVRRGIIL